MSLPLDAVTAALQNQFLSGGAALMVMGAVMALCRRLPSAFYNWLRRRCTVTVDVMNSDPVFDWLSQWLDAHPYSKRATRLTISSKASLSDGGSRTVIFTPAPGNHFFVYRRRLVWFNRERNVAGSGGKDEDGEAMGSFRQRETYTLRVIGRGQEVARQLIEEARRCANAAAAKEADLYISGPWYWSKIGALSPRSIESVVLPDGVTARIVEDIREFLESREWYAARGIPWRRGHLYEGVPGSGKSSLIRAVASTVKLNLYMLNIGSAGMSDEKLNSLMSEVKDNSVVLLEDVDAAARRPLAAATEPGAAPVPETKGITFSGLLNALDGVNAREGVIVVMTTNHVERLDEALIRPGRVDFRQHFDYATPAQARALFRNFYSGDHIAGLAEAFASQLPANTSMASVQQLLILHKREPEKAAAAFAAAV
jgi:chaperone BCS1